MRTAVTLLPLCFATVLFSGCQNDPGGAGPDLGPPEFQSAPLDPEINPEDTYVAFDATSTSETVITSAEPVPDPITGQLTTEIHLPGVPDADFGVEAGYDNSGAVRTNITCNCAPSLDPQSQLAPEAYRIRLSDGQLYEYNPSGSMLPLPAQPTADAPTTDAVLSVFGADLISGAITSGLLLDSLEDGLLAAQASLRSGSLPASRSIGTPVRQAVSITGSAALVSTQLQLDAGAHGRGPTVERRYLKRGSKWQLDEITSSFESPPGRVTVRQVNRIKLNNLVIHVNSAKDSTRALRRATGAVPASAGQQAARPWKASPSFLKSCEFYGTCEEEDPPPPPPPPPSTNNLAYVHGYRDVSGVWSSMRPWIRADLDTYSIYDFAPQLSNTASAQTQALQLESAIQATGRAGLSGFVVIGHSMGGLVARVAAADRPDLIRGVITLGTPHQGALLANYSSDFLTGVVQGWGYDLFGGCASRFESPECYIGHFVLNSALAWAVSSSFHPEDPAIADLKVGNPLVTGLNARTENFLRVGIQSYPDKDWMLFRLVGDAYCDVGPAGDCGGQAWARYVGRVRNGLKLCAIFAVLLNDSPVFYGCYREWTGLDRINVGWNELSAPHDERSDGMVGGTSQIYPRASFNYPVPNGVSHPGEPKSGATRITLGRALREWFVQH